MFFIFNENATKKCKNVKKKCLTITFLWTESRSIRGTKKIWNWNLQTKTTISLCAPMLLLYVHRSIVFKNFKNFFLIFFTLLHAPVFKGSEYSIYILFFMRPFFRFIWYKSPPRSERISTYKVSHLPCITSSGVNVRHASCILVHNELRDHWYRKTVPRRCAEREWPNRSVVKIGILKNLIISIGIEPITSRMNVSHRTTLSPLHQ